MVTNMLSTGTKHECILQTVTCKMDRLPREPVHWSSLTRRRCLKRKEIWRKLLLLGIQTGDKLAKPPFFVAYSRLCRHCRSLAEGGCLLSRFHFTLCRYFLGHVACKWNLPWQGHVQQRPALMLHKHYPHQQIWLLICDTTGKPPSDRVVVVIEL